MEELYDELIRYLTSNFISFSTYKENGSCIFTINKQTYELFEPNEEGKFFDESFRWDCDRTDYDNYIFRFADIWYSLKKGNETAVKLEKVKWIGSVKVEEPALLQQNFLGVHGPFELMNGSGNYKDWCAKANFLGIKSLGICEKGTLAGTLKFQVACQKAGIKPILGMEIPIQVTSTDTRYSVKAFVKDEKGWTNLLWMNKLINVDSSDKSVSEEDLNKYHEGLIYIYDPKSTAFSQLPTDSWIRPGNYYQLDPVEYNKDDRDETYLKNLRGFYNSKMSPVLMSDAYYLEKEYAPIRTKLNQLAGTMFYESENQYFKNGEELWLELTELFKNKFDDQFDSFSRSMENLNDICDSCNFTVETNQRHLPKYYMTPEEAEKWSTNEEMFIDLVYSGIEDHLDLLEQWDDDVIAERLEREIKVIKDGDVIDYFLILRDIINWCKKNGILLGAGRGSAAGSLCSYLLGITKVDPLKYNLLFERFLSSGRLGKKVDVEMILINDEFEIEAEKILKISRNDQIIEIKALSLQKNDKILNDEILCKM